MSSRFAPHRQPVHATAYTLVKETGISNYFNDDTELQDMSADSLSLARAQRIKRNTVGTFNTLEKVAIENKFLTYRGIFITMMEVAHK